MLTTAVGRDGKPHPNGVWLAWIKTHGALGPLRRRQQVRAERRDVRLALASGAQHCLRRRRNGHELLERRPELRAARLHRRPELRRPGRRRRAHDPQRGPERHRRDDRGAVPAAGRHSAHRRGGSRRLPLLNDRSRGGRAVDPPSSRPLRQQHTGRRPPASPRRIDPFVCRPGPSAAPTLAVRVRCRSERRLTAPLRDYLECEPIERSSVLHVVALYGTARSLEDGLDRDKDGIACDAS